jgi:hypothetical protein
MNGRTITLGKRFAGLLVYAACLTCTPSGNTRINDVVAQFVPRLYLGMPLDSATSILTDVRTVEYWGHIGRLEDVKDFPLIGVRTKDNRPGAAGVAEIHMFSPRREIVPEVVQAISSAARVRPQERCSGNQNLVVYVWHADGGRILLTDNRGAAPGADPVHLWFVAPETDRRLSYSLEPCE